ncbi:MAG: prepilin peptidase [Acidobacteriaceae bacterium]|nr:prepilin peptidase [Acidobacteriaceae bacterium]
MIEAVAAGLLGLLIGSFLNVCIYRLPRDLTVWAPARSFCPACERGIAWYDNLPVFSYLWLRGRCRQCGERIPARYLLTEVLCGVMFFVSAWFWGWSLQAGKMMMFSAINLTLFFSDLEERILPDEFTLGGALAGLVWAYFVALPMGLTMLFLPLDTPARWISVAEGGFAAGLAYGSFRLLGWSYERFRGREGLGMGDMKMVAMFGAFLGLMSMLEAILIGSVLGSVLGLAFIKLRREDSAQYELPFGSFLAVGAVAAAWLEALR